jgi:hypothetical protein
MAAARMTAARMTAATRMTAAHMTATARMTPECMTAAHMTALVTMAAMFEASAMFESTSTVLEPSSLRLATFLSVPLSEFTVTAEPKEAEFRTAIEPVRIIVIWVIWSNVLVTI